MFFLSFKRSAQTRKRARPRGKRTAAAKIEILHPRKLTCPPKRDYFNRKYIFQPLVFRGHVSFSGSSQKHTEKLLKRLKSSTKSWRHIKGHWLLCQILPVNICEWHDSKVLRLYQLIWHPVSYFQNPYSNTQPTFSFFFQDVFLKPGKKTNNNIKNISSSNIKL